MAQEVAPPVALLDDVYTKTTTTSTTIAEPEAAAVTRTLGCLLSNHLVLSQTLPHLPPSAVLSLAATSRAFRDLIYGSPVAFRHLDLTQVKTAQFDIDPIDTGGELWHNTQLDEHLTEDEFYSGPLRGIFSNLCRSNLLSSVHTLILDGLSVTAELVHDMLTGPSFRIRVLSLRDVKNLNERKLQQALTTACRPSRPEGTPHLKAVYLFTRRDAESSSSSSRASIGLGSGSSSSTSAGSAPVSSLQQTINASSPHRTAPSPMEWDEGDAWYDRRGKMLSRGISREWAHTLLACQGIIAFDAVLCAGPRHSNSRAFGKVPVSSETAAAAAGTGEPQQSQWAVATYAVGECAGCGGAPEGVTVWGRNDTPHDYPLLVPAPLHSSSVKAACRPSRASLEARELVGEWRGSSNSETANGDKERGDHCGPPRFVARCFECLKGRCCWSCNKWWCESCYAGPGGGGGGGGADDKRGVTKSCWECGDNCHECISKTQLMCKSCCGGYCIIHNEGSGPKHCDWCSRGSRRTRDLY
ncbi:hypothetical protein RB600_009909 [Gaeumannomyces tritici]